MTWMRLRELVTRHFDIEELRTLCFDLNVDYDALRGEGKEAKVRELVGRLRRERRVAELVTALAERRPEIAWSEPHLSTEGTIRAGVGQRSLWLVGGAVVLLVAAVVLFRAIFPAGMAAPTPELPSAMVRPSETPVSPLTPSKTPTPAPMPTDTPSPTLEPTNTPQPKPTPSCPAVGGPFEGVWGSVRAEIGCAVGDAVDGKIVEENFEGGKMFWREPVDYAQALVLFNDGTWRIFEHSPYGDDRPEFSCVDENTPAECPPTPKRGFGMMWCDIPEIRNGLGNAIDCEHEYQGAMQQFEGGFMLRSESGVVYVFYDGGRWERR
jgi:hypothetical protein